MSEQMLESVRRELEREEDELDFFRGAIVGCIFVLPFWVGIIIAIVKFARGEL